MDVPFIKWNGKPKRRSLTRCAFKTNLPAHEFYNALGHGQSQSRTTVASGARAVPLSERFKKVFLRIFVNSDACIRDAPREPHLGLGLFFYADTQGDFA